MFVNLVSNRYADRPYAYWTGYLTSRPALKGYVRTRNALLRATDKFASTFGSEQNVQSLVDASLVLREAFSVAQHHDAVAGTVQERRERKKLVVFLMVLFFFFKSKQHVANDYAKLLANGSVAIQSAIASVIEELSEKS